MNIPREVTVNVKKSLLPSMLVCAVLALTGRRLARPAAAQAASNSAPYDTLDAYVQQQMRRLNMPGAALAVVEDERIVHTRGFGRARPGGGAPSLRTPFVLGSTTKSFTALAVMQLVEAGKIELDAPVRRYLPWFRVADRRASAQISVRHLLNQTSGLPQLPGLLALTDFDDSPAATERQARALASVELSHPPGSAFEYSNANYNVLGLIVEAASGESYADYVQTHIFDPLGMSHSFTSLAAAKRDGLAVGHRHWFTHPVAVPRLRMPRGSLPSGQLISCAEDMGRYLIAHLDGGRYGSVQLLSSAGIDELHRAAVENTTLGITVKYGMGWFVTDEGPTRIIWHSGTVPDFSSFIALLPEQKKGIVLLFNADHYMLPPVIAEAGLGAASLLGGQEPAPGPFGYVPSAFRGLLLIPLLQIVGVAATLRLLGRWHRDPALRPDRGRLWGRHLLLPLLPNLSLAALPLFLQRSGTFRLMKLFLPDVAWLALICGTFAGIWACLRTVLVLRAVRKL